MWSRDLHATARSVLPEPNKAAYAGIHGAAVALVTGNVWLGLLEWLLHTVIDDMKVKGKTSFAADQALHLLCKVAWLAVHFTVS